jgi:Fe-S-cluster-containing hydrogenase component 2
MVEINDEACVGCGLCANVCPTGAISLAAGKARVNPLVCSACGQCLEVCRTGAVHWKYKETERRRPRAVDVRRRVPTHWFFPAKQGSPRWSDGKRDFRELRQRLEDLKKKAEEVARRIEDL